MPSGPALSVGKGGLCFSRGARMTVLSAGLEGSSFELIGADPLSRRDDCAFAREMRFELSIGGGPHGKAHLAET